MAETSFTDHPELAYLTRHEGHHPDSPPQETIIRLPTPQGGTQADPEPPDPQLSV